MVSKIAECESKNLNASQPDEGQNAMGIPHLSESGAPEVISEGILLRGKNQTEIPLSTHCTTTLSAKAGTGRVHGILTSIHTTAVVIEARSIGVLLGSRHPASGVPGLGGSTVCTPDDISGDSERRTTRRGDRATMAGVDRRLVVGVVVHAFHDVDLATGRPVGSIAPERRPRPTASRHMHGIKENQSARVGERGGDTDGFAVARDLGCGVDTHDGVASGVDLDEVRRLLQHTVRMCDKEI